MSSLGKASLPSTYFVTVQTLCKAACSVVGQKVQKEKGEKAIEIWKGGKSKDNQESGAQSLRPGPDPPVNFLPILLFFSLKLFFLVGGVSHHFFYSNCSFFMTSPGGRDVTQCCFHLTTYFM